jgi:hypothetical protein
MKYKVIPFTAQITRNDSAAAVATQMQSIIDSQVSSGWEYLRMDSVETSVAGSSGCFGIGAQPPFSTSYNVLVFKQKE